MLIKLLEPLLVEQKIIEEYKSKIESMGHKFIAYNTKPIDICELEERIADADIAIISSYPVPKDIICNAQKLKLLSIAFTGVDHIGLDGAKKNNVKICNSAGYSDIAVSELAVGLSINILRKILIGDNATRRQGTSKGLFGSVLHGKTVGIVGCGNIGKRTAKLFNAFDCKVLGTSIKDTEEDLKKYKIEKVDIDTLLKNSDIVSLHIPAKEDTINFIDKEKLCKMKNTAILINTARGAVVDNGALADALNNGEIRGAGIDVFDMEPPIPSEYKLLKAKNTLFTPHIAYATEESMLLRAQIAFENVFCYLDGDIQNEIL